MALQNSIRTYLFYFLFLPTTRLLIARKIFLIRLWKRKFIYFCARFYHHPKRHKNKIPSMNIRWNCSFFLAILLLTTYYKLLFNTRSLLALRYILTIETNYQDFCVEPNPKSKITNNTKNGPLFSFTLIIINLLISHNDEEIQTKT